MSTLPIDVVIPCWGAAHAAHLPRALASVSVAARRTIVGDDIAREVGLANGASDAIELLTRHPGPARMQALTVTNQPYILFMDADDAVLPGGLEHLHALLSKHPKAVAAAGYFRRSHNGTYWPRPRDARLATSPIGLHALMFKNMLPAHGSILIRRDALLDLREPFETAAINEDWHGIIRLRAHGKILFTHMPIYDYTVTEGSMSRSPRNMARVRASYDALLQTAENELGRLAPTLRIAAAIARPGQRRHIEQAYGVYQQPENTTPAADITYD